MGWAARGDCGSGNPCPCQCVQHGLQLDVQLCGRYGHWAVVQQHRLGNIYWCARSKSNGSLYSHGATVFAALNALIIPVVYFFFPETAGRSLEDMDVVFALAYKEGVSPVKVSLRKDVPLAGSPEADEILGITDNVSGQNPSSDREDTRRSKETEKSQ